MSVPHCDVPEGTEAICRLDKFYTCEYGCKTLLTAEYENVVFGEIKRKIKMFYN